MTTMTKTTAVVLGVTVVVIFGLGMLFANYFIVRRPAQQAICRAHGMEHLSLGSNARNWVCKDRDGRLYRFEEK
jgi:hypothetical protein